MEKKNIIEKINIFQIRKKQSIENIFVLIAVLLGIVFAAVNPFGQEPDGWVHFTRAMDVSYGNVFAPFRDNFIDGNWMVLPVNLLDVNFHVIEIGTHEAVAYMENIKNVYFSDVTTPMEGLGGFASMFYWPQAFGLWIARLLGLSVFGHMVLGRVCNLLVYVALTYAGLKKMPVFKMIYLMIAMLPITLYQAASFSYDAMLNGLCFLFIGLCFHYAYEKEQLSWKDVLVLGIILGALACCKYIYVCIGLLVFIIPMQKFGSTKNYWKSFAIALIPLVLMGGLVIYSTSIVSVATGAVSNTAEPQLTQFGYILENPLALVKVFLTTIPMYFSRYIDQLHTFGWLNMTLEPLRYLVPVFVCIVALLDTKRDEKRVKIKDKVICFATFAITVCAGMLGLYLMDATANPVGAAVIKGYQGRYVIPVLMLLLVLLPSNKVENKTEHFSGKVIGVMSLYLVFAVVCLSVLCY